MEWLFYAFLAAILTALSVIIQKGILNKEHSIEFSTIFVMVVAIISLVFIPKVNFAILDSKILIFVYAVSWLEAFGFFLIMKSLRHLNISLVSPLLNFEVLLIAFLALIFLGETLNIVNWFGIIILLFGTYFLQTKKIDDYKSFFINIKSKYILLLFLALVFYAFSALADRFILKSYLDPITYLFFVHIFIAFNFFILHLIFHEGVDGIRSVFKRQWRSIILVAVVVLTARLSLFMAVSITSVALVVSIKRLSSLFSILFGGELFHERDVLHKFMAAVFMLIGAILIVL